MTTTRSVGLSLSGGGFRATAFGLGCLRALHDCGVLAKVRVVSGVSGGSLLAALWAYGPADFGEFDDLTVGLLRQGLQLEMARRALAPHNLLRSAGTASRALLPRPLRSDQPYNRTDALRATLAARVFGDRLISTVNRPCLATVINATDLITSRAVRFGSTNSSCSQHGRIQEQVHVAEAVAASAAYPILLPPIRRTYTFERNGHEKRIGVTLADGGIYDNLGLSVLEPGRSTDHSGHVYPVDYIIACDAGRQESSLSSARRLPARLVRSFNITYRKTQDASRSKLHTAGSTGQIQGFVHCYLGMQDENVPSPITDLVPLQRVNTYKTNFRRMSADDLRAITTRGEQLVRALLAHYCPTL